MKRTFLQGLQKRNWIAISKRIRSEDMERLTDADLVDWNYTYSTGKGEKTKAFYKVLELYGFQYPNDEEKGVVEGTSDLYVKKEGAK